MDSVVSNALKRREELQRELREVDRFLVLYERFTVSSPQGSLPGFDDPGEEEHVEPGSGPTAEPLPSVSAETVSDDGNAEPMPKLNRREMVPHIRDIILEANRPLTRGHLLRRLERRGVKVGGSYDPAKNMGTIMWRLREDFVNLPGQGYWPRQTPYLPSGYVPDSPADPPALTSDFDEQLG